MVWSVGVYDTITGSPRLVLDAVASKAPWRRSLAGSASGSVSVRLRGQAGLSASKARDLFADTRNTVAVLWDGAAVAGGPCIGRTSWDRDAGVLTAEYQELPVILKDRLLHGVDNYAAGNLTLTNVSYGVAVASILSRATQWGPLWKLPLTLPTGSGSGTFKQAWKNYQVLTIEDCLSKVRDRGQEIDFHPVIGSDGSLSWTVRVSSKVTAGVFDLPVTAASSAVTGLKVVSDSSSRLTGVLAVGNGTGSEMKTAYAGSLSIGAGDPVGPIRDAVRHSKDEREDDQLQAVADAEMRAALNPVEQWSFSVRAGSIAYGLVPPTRIPVGCRLVMDVRGDEWIPDGRYEKRVIALSGDFGDTVQVEVQDA